MSLDKVLDIVIIGAGPGGIAAAIESKLAGKNKILVLEKTENHCDVIRKFYKPGKRVDKDWQGKKFDFIGHVTFQDCSKEEFLDQMDKKIKEFKIENKIKYNHHVYGIEKNSDGIFEIGADHELGVIQARNVIIAIGRMGKPNKPKYKFPPKIRPRLNFNLDKVQKGEKVLIVGGGDTAGEYAYGLVDMNINCNVTLNYRKAEITKMNPANKTLVEKYIKEKKLKSKLGVDIINVEPYEKENITPPKVKVNFTDGSSEIFDRVVYALGGTAPIDFLKNIGIEVNEKGEPVYEEKTMQTNIKGLYIIGDVATSNGGSIALAFNHAYLAVQNIIKN